MSESTVSLSAPKGHFSSDIRNGLVVMLLISVALISISYYHYLIFHVLAEFFAVGVAIIMFIVIWNTYSFSNNHYLMFLACGYFWIGWLDVAHTLLYFGMPTALDQGNYTSQFWIATRASEALLLLTAPLFLRRSFPRQTILLLFGLIATTIAVLILQDYFPTTFVPGKGLTSFKVMTEYLIIAILLLAIGHLYLHQQQLDRRIFRIMVICLLLTIGSELAFTFYVSMYGISNLVGHLFKLFSFWLIYVAIIRSTLAEPFATLAQESTTYNAIPLPIILVDRTGTIFQFNRAACAMVGSTSSLIHQSCHSLFHPQQAESEDCPVCSAIRNNQAIDALELDMGEQHGWRRFTITPIEHSQLASGLAVHVIEDITQRRKAEATLHDTLLQLDQTVSQRTQLLQEKLLELEQTRDQLIANEKMASLGRLVAGFAHEINTPIGIAVAAMSQIEETAADLQCMLQRTDVTEEELTSAVETLVDGNGLAYKNIQRAAKLIARFKRSSIDRTSQIKRHYQLCEILQDSIASMQNQLRQQRVEVAIHCAETLTLHGDPGMIEQIMVVLLENSLHHAFTDAQPQHTVEINATIADQLIIRYRDNGKGINAESMPHIFEPFYTTTRNNGGSGLGLYISYNLIIQAGGSISCSSEPDAGCQFTITLPL